MVNPYVLHFTFFKTMYWKPDDSLLRPKHVAVLKEKQTVVLDGILKVYY
jgi:hypothetical protein